MLLVGEAAEAVSAHPDPDHLGAWLQLRSRTSGLALEAVDDVLRDVLKQDPEAVNKALKTLDLGERARALLAIGEAESLNIEPEALQDARIAADETVRVEGLEAANPRPLLAFRGSGSLPVAQGRKTIVGTLTVSGSDGKQTTYKAHTGGWGGASYHERGGPLPPGMYTIVAKGKPTGPFVKGMSSPDQAASFYFLLKKPDADTIVHLASGAIRDGLCIHPDGNPPGTLGCIGLAETGAIDNDCRDRIEELRRAGQPVWLEAKYEPGVLVPVVS
jgi:hypothetical protein